MSKEKKIRIRCAGIVTKNNKILLVRSNYDNKEYWILPGGGLEMNESLYQCLVREIKEETGVLVKPIKLVFLDEDVNPDKTMVHLTFLCEVSDDSNLSTGTDPDQDRKVIEEAQYVNIQTIKTLENFIPKKMLDPLIKGLHGGFKDFMVNLSE